MNTYKIPLVDLSIQNKQIKKDIYKIFNSLLKTSSFTKGPSLEKFEKAYAKYIKATYAIGVASGTDALYLGLLALDIKKGDEVIMPVNTFVASAYATLLVGAKPIFVDCNQETGNIDTRILERYITKKTKVIIPAHLYGQAADMESVIKLAKKHNLYVIEDAAQAHGAYVKTKPVGSYGIITTWSFYPAKNLGAWGDGGMITTNSTKLAKKIKMLREYGSSDKYTFETIGINSRLDAMQAAILEAKLPHLTKWNKERQKSAQYYSKKLANLFPQIKTPSIDKNNTHVFHLYVIQTEKRDQLASFLAKHGIQTGIHYPIPLHMQHSLKNLGYKKGDFPVAEKLSQSILSIPLYPGITITQQDQIIKTIYSFFDKQL